MKKIKINKRTFNKYRFHIAIGVLVTTFVVLSRIPYINLFVMEFSGIMLWMSVIIWIGFNGVHIIRFGVVLFFILCLLTLFNENVIAERAGETTFLVLLTGVILLIRDALKKE